VKVEVSKRTGLLPTEKFDGEVIEEIFIAGTQPKQFDQRFEFEEAQEDRLVDRLRDDLETRDLGLLSLETDTTASVDGLDLRLDFELPDEDDGGLDVDLPDDEESNPLLD
jgi:hypothetical protein